MYRQKSARKKYPLLLVLSIVIILGIGATAFLHARSDDTAISKAAAKSSAAFKKSDTKNPATTAIPGESVEPASFNKTQYSTTDPTSPWVIVNKQHPLNPKDYTPSDLTSVGNGQYMRADAAKALSSMLAAAKAAGYTITADSAYRSYSTQVSVYNKEVADYGQAVADSESARPGFSEHQTGWAVDIGSGSCHITDCFGELEAGKWSDANAYKYGFILRYTPADVTTTGYRAEAWHFRYIGVALASELHDRGVATLEEYFGVTGGSTYAQ